MKLILCVASLLTVCLLFFFLNNYSKVDKFIQGDQISEEVNPSYLKLLDLHNEQRINKGYKPLLLDKNLCNYAQKHANYMVEKNKLIHSNMSDIQKVNQDSSTVGENIAWGQETEESVVSTWMWSPMHRWNILGSSYKRVGFGVAKDKNDRKYWCVVFSN